MVVVLGYTGQINLAQAAFFGLGAYGVALGTVGGGLNFWISLALGVGAATVAGLAPRAHDAAARRPLPGDDHDQLPADLRPDPGQLDGVHPRPGRHRRHRPAIAVRLGTGGRQGLPAAVHAVLYALVFAVWYLPQHAARAAPCAQCARTNSRPKWWACIRCAPR